MRNGACHAGSGIAALVLLFSGLAMAESASTEPDLVAKGAALFAENCQTCHGSRMRNPQWGIDLRQFPRDGNTRFVNSVTYGKRQMPSWEDVLKPEDIEALWAYVSSGDPD